MEKYKKTYNYLYDYIDRHPEHDLDINLMTDQELSELLKCFTADSGQHRLNHRIIEGVMSSVRFNFYLNCPELRPITEQEELRQEDNRQRVFDLRGF